MANEVFEAARTVMAVREYQDKPVPGEVLRRIIEAGRLSASASNGQPWHFIVVRDRANLRKLGSLIRTGPYVANAPAAIIVAYEKEKGEYGMSDASRAIQNMILTAWGEGVGSNWTGFAHMEGVREDAVLKLDHRGGGLVVHHHPHPRAAVDRVVRRDRKHHPE